MDEKNKQPTTPKTAGPKPSAAKPASPKPASPKPASPKPATTLASSPSQARNQPQGGFRQRISIVAVVGLCLLAGFAGSWLQSNVLGGNLRTIEERKSLLIKEDSAVIDVAQQVSPSVVSITTNSNTVDFFGQSQNQASSGTGVILKSNGLILTNKHVVEGGQSFTVITSDGKKYEDAKVVAKDPSNDIAFLQISATGLTAAKLGDSSKVQVGQRVIAIGNALGQFQNTVTTGVISGKSRPITASGGAGGAESLQNLFQTDAAINPGNSGGPLVNIAGEVIGLNTAVAGDGAQNIGFAIPINEAKKDITSVSNGGKIVRPYLGVRYTTVTQDIAASNDLVSEAIGGAYIGAGNSEGVLAGSPADKSGLRNGDIIIKLNNTKLDEANALSSTIAQYNVGDTVAVTYLRDGKTKTVKVKLGEAPAQ